MPLPTLDETKTMEQGRSDTPPATLKKCRSAGTLQEVAQHVDRRRSRASRDDDDEKRPVGEGKAPEKS